MKIKHLGVTQLMNRVQIDLTCDDDEQADRLFAWLENNLRAGKVVRLRPADPGNAPSVETVQ